MRYAPDTTQRRRLIGEPKSSSGRIGLPHSSQSMAAMDENAAPQLGQRAARGVPHSTQKRAPSALTVEQDGQVNYLPITHTTSGRNTPGVY